MMQMIEFPDDYKMPMGQSPSESIKCSQNVPNSVKQALGWDDVSLVGIEDNDREARVYLDFMLPGWREW